MSLEVLVTSEIDKAAEALIQETEIEYKNTEFADVDAELAAPAGGESPPPGEAGAVEPAVQGGAAGTPVAEPPPANASESVGMERLVAREVALLQREETLKAREKQWAAMEAKLAELEGKRLPDNFSDQFETEPDAALERLGIDPEQAIRRIIARKLEARGQEVPEKLRAEIRQAEKDSKYLRELQDIKSQLAQERAARDARAFFDQVSQGAKEYVTTGVSEFPTVAAVARTNPDAVHSEIMEVISRDAQEKAARDPNAPLLSYAEATKRVESRWAGLRNLLGLPASSVTPEGKPAASTPPAKTPEASGKPNNPPQTKTTPIVQPPDKPLAPWLQKPETDDEGLKAALMEYRRVEKLGTP